MKTRHFEVVLQTDVQISKAGTVEGPQTPLDYLPGRLFLGTAARALYRRGRNMETWQACHSGALHFGDGFPIAPNGQITFPVPLSWHCPKNNKPERGDDLEKKDITNLAAPNFGSSWDHDSHTPGGGCQTPSAPHQSPGPLQQIRGLYTSTTGFAWQPPIHLSMKTGIDPATARPVKSQLFPTHALMRGQRFYFQIRAYDDLPERLLDRVAAILTGPQKLGSSRSAEFGRVSIRQLAQKPVFEIDSRWNERGLLCLWLLSDAAVCGPDGLFSQNSTPAQWGCPPGKLQLAHSFRRHHTVARFNGHYRRFEREQFLTERGSVLVFKLDQKAQASQLQRLQHMGIGLHRQMGLGRTWVNPPLLWQTTPQFQEQSGFQIPPASKSNKATPNEASSPPGPLAQWLRDFASREEAVAQAGHTADQWAKSLAQLYRNAQILAGAGPQQLLGPSSSQWGLVRQAARFHLHSGTIKDLETQLFDGPNAICGHQHDFGERTSQDRAQLDVDWFCQTVTPAGKVVFFRDWLRQLVTRPEATPAALAFLARKGQHLTKQRGLDQTNHSLEEAKP